MDLFYISNNNSEGGDTNACKDGFPKLGNEEDSDHVEKSQTTFLNDSDGHEI